MLLQEVSLQWWNTFLVWRTAGDMAKLIETFPSYDTTISYFPTLVWGKLLYYVMISIVTLWYTLLPNSPAVQSLQSGGQMRRSAGNIANWNEKNSPHHMTILCFLHTTMKFFSCYVTKGIPHCDIKSCMLLCSAESRVQQRHSAHNVANLIEIIFWTEIIF